MCKITTVYEAIAEGTDGRPEHTGKFFESKAEAEAYSAPKTWSGNGRSEQRLAVETDVRTLLIEKEIKVRSESDESDTVKALAKLTPRERKLLGLE